jgi:hypothetical protein
MSVLLCDTVAYIGLTSECWHPAVTYTEALLASAAGTHAVALAAFSIKHGGGQGGTETRN